MKKYLLGGVFLLLIGSVSLADELKERFHHYWMMGLNFRSFDYKEDLTPPLRSEEKAQFMSPFLAYRYKNGPWSWEAQFDGFFDFSSQYTGTTLSGVETEGEDRHSLWDFGLQLGYDVIPDFQIFSGLGYHFWDRFLNGETGYREIYTWYFVDLGAEWTFLSANFEVGQLNSSFRFRYRQMYQGSIHIVFSETYSAGEDSTLKLGDKGGYWLEWPLKLSLVGNRSALLLTPWYSRSEIGASNVTYNGTPLRSGVLGRIREPASLTQEMGLKIGLERAW